LVRFPKKKGYGSHRSPCCCWRAPSERIRTASEILIEVELRDEASVPAYMKISEKVLHLRRLGMAYSKISEHLGVNLWMAKKAARWAKAQNK